MVSKLSEISCRLFIQDPDPGSGPDFLPIPDPGVKKAPDPGSGSATLDTVHNCVGKVFEVNLQLLLRIKVCQGRAPDDRPPYFKFMTILAFNIFWREGVDVAIVEVGIGGQYDCTNILRNPRVTGQHQSACLPAEKNGNFVFERNYSQLELLLILSEHSINLSVLRHASLPKGGGVEWTERARET
jgi:hypothetical protein